MSCTAKKKKKLELRPNFKSYNILTKRGIERHIPPCNFTLLILFCVFYDITIVYLPAKCNVITNYLPLNSFVVRDSDPKTMTSVLS